MVDNYDFCGWATRNDLKCSDGRIIRKDAFKHHDGEKVPLVWNHDHTDPYRVVGHALLENRDEGVYTYGFFNDTDLGRTAKTYVEHGDITSLSIYANQLKQQGPNVMHGCIREVSLVLAGANPGAYIENVIKHGDESDDEARIFTGLEFELYHAEGGKKEESEKKGDNDVAEEAKNTENSGKEKTVQEIFDSMTEEQKQVVYLLVGEAAEGNKEVKHADTNEDMTVEEVYDTFTEEQKTVVHALIGQAIEDAVSGKLKIDDEEESEGGNEEMKHNLFDQEERYEEVLSHGEVLEMFENAKQCGSLKQAMKEAALAHGITDIEMLFPEYQSLSKEPDLIARDQTWVDEVLKSVHHTPFAKIKSIHANITAEEARAKGYTKGNLKVEEVIKMLRRETNPTTIYKKQKLDRDDILDINDYDLVGWLWREMRVMFNEELARAILFGDGRDVTTNPNDKINEECIRPVWTDTDLYTYKTKVELAPTATEKEKVKAFIRAAIKARKHYKGSGSPTMYATEDMITDCLLLEDENGRIIYDSMSKLASALGVSKIVPIPLEELKRDVDGTTHTLLGLYVNLRDYNIGTNKGGELGKFEDFDIDYNQYKYLMEGRCSGALTKPYSAVAIELVTTA